MVNFNHGCDNYVCILHYRERPLNLYKLIFFKKYTKDGILQNVHELERKGRKEKLSNEK